MSIIPQLKKLTKIQLKNPPNKWGGEGKLIEFLMQILCLPTLDGQGIF